MFSKAKFTLFVVLSVVLPAVLPQLGHAGDKFAVTGEFLTQDDGPFLVYGYNDDVAADGVLLKDTDSLATAQQKAAEYVSANANKGGRAEIIAYTQKPAKKSTVRIEKPTKKDFKDEKKAEPTPEPTKPAPAPVSLKGSTWTGTESASDTTSLRFVFKEDGSVIAYDDTRFTWKGTWRMIGDTNVVIELTSPNSVNYSGQIKGNRITGKAGRPGAGQWNWSVERQ
jgi:hypothetical protein